MSMLIGLAGWKQSGKSTAANHLINQHDFWEQSWAWGLKEVIGRQLFNLDDEILYGDSPKREEVISEWGMSGREILQKVGTDLFRKQIHPDFWVMALLPRLREALSNDRKVVVSDCRFPNEADAVSKLGGKMVRIVRIGQVQEDTHESETALNNYKFPHTIYAESGDFDTLYAEIDKLVKGE